MSGEEGVTFIEIIVVVALLGVISCMAAPSFIRWRQNVELQGNVRLFAADLQKAKMLAVKLNSFVALRFDSQGYTVFIDDGSGGGKAGDYIRNGAESTVLVRQMSQSVRFRQNFSADRLRFSGFGGNKTGTAVFRHENGKQMKVVVSVLGRVRITGVS